LREEYVEIPEEQVDHQVTDSWMRWLPTVLSAFKLLNRRTFEVAIPLKMKNES